MPPDRLEKIKSRLAAATPGPWVHEEGHLRQEVIMVEGQVVRAGAPLIHCLGDKQIVCNECGANIEHKYVAAFDLIEDADLAAHAPADLTYLLRLVEVGEQVIKASRRLRMWLVEPPEGTAYCFMPDYLKLNDMTKQQAQQVFDDALATYAVVQKEGQE